MTQKQQSNSESKRSEVQFLQIEPTTRCNFICGFCCGRHMDQSDISWSTFKHTVDSLPDLTHMELQGEGEPLLHKDFFKMAHYATDRGIKLSTITNGSLFSNRRIPQILDSGISAILVSIESADAALFQKIRGGKFSNVKEGVQAFIAARDARGTSVPSVGFAVTVMKSTRDQVEGIVELYQELGLDGGILMHTLSHMDAYADFYDESINAELMSDMDQAMVWARFRRLLRTRPYHESGQTHFWDDLLGREKGQQSQTSDLSGFQSCPWLDRSLFVNRHGVATACPNVKNTERFAFGQVADGFDNILAQRRALHTSLQSGEIPAPCSGCFVATSVQQSVRHLSAGATAQDQSTKIPVNPEP
jgi:MoaA/NifB/PqqE/SkfB family radical SAM enzyme